MNPSIKSTLQSRLDARKTRSRRRYRVESQSVGSADASVNGHTPGMIRLGDEWLVNFGSNDYLGFAQSIQQPAGLNLSEFGCRASPLVSGWSSELSKLETELARFESAESALVFSSGYAANVGTIQSLISPRDLVIYDEYCHASMIDGLRLCGASGVKFAHNDVDSLCRSYVSQNDSSFEQTWLLTESVFSMDGDQAPLQEIVAFAKSNSIGTIVDEAHATGVYGAIGQGLCCELGLSDEIDVRIGTLSKGLGCHGGFVVGDATLIDWLVNSARSYIYSTALPSGVASSARTALTRSADASPRRAFVRQIATQFRRKLVSAGFETSGTDSPIVPIYVGNDSRVLSMAKKLAEHGYYLPAIRSPTVPRNRALLRCSLTALHTNEQIDHLLDCLQRLV